MSLLNYNYWVQCLISYIQGVMLGVAKDQSRIFFIFPHLCLCPPAHDPTVNLSTPCSSMFNFLKCTRMAEEPTEDTAVYLLQNSFNLWGILSIRRGIEQDKRRKRLVLCFNKPFQSLHFERGAFWLTVDQSIKLSHRLTSVERHEKGRPCPKNDYRALKSAKRERRTDWLLLTEQRGKFDVLKIQTEKWKNSPTERWGCSWKNRAWRHHRLTRHVGEVTLPD